jgi:hypothetical protein
MTAIQGTTGGAIMATTGLAMTGVGALAALVPVVALPVGVLVGRRAFRDHHERQLNIRRQELKREAQKYVNEVAFGVSKDSKDRLRASQRTLRDHFTARAAELERSLAAAEHAAKDAADGTARVGAGGGKPSAAAADAEQLGVARTIAARMMVARPAARTP